MFIKNCQHIKYNIITTSHDKIVIFISIFKNIIFYNNSLNNLLHLETLRSPQKHRIYAFIWFIPYLFQILSNSQLISGSYSIIRMITNLVRKERMSLHGRPSGVTDRVFGKDISNVERKATSKDQRPHNKSHHTKLFPRPGNPSNLNNLVSKNVSLL